MLPINTRSIHRAIILIVTISCIIATNIACSSTLFIAEQFLAPFEKDLKKITAHIHDVYQKLKDPTQKNNALEKQYARLKKTQKELNDAISNYSILFSRIAPHYNHEKAHHIFDQADYEHNLYVACGAFDREHDTYPQNEHLLKLLAKHATLQCGIVTWAQNLATPTSSTKKLIRKQNGVKELIKHPDVVKQLEYHLQKIAQLNLENSFLSLWKDDEQAAIEAYAPYAGNSSFGPFLSMMTEWTHQSDAAAQEIAQMVRSLNKSPLFLNTANWSTFIQDIGIILLGVSMITKGCEDLVKAVKELPQDAAYLGGWKVVMLPVIIVIAQAMVEKIITLSCNNALAATVIPALETIIQQTGLSDISHKKENNTIVITSASQETLTTLQHNLAPMLEEDCTIQANGNTLCVRLTQQKERHIRCAHPLYNHKTLATVIIPFVSYLLTVHLTTGTPLLANTDITIPGTSYSLKSPGCLLLPWHLIKIFTTIGLIPAYAYQHFFKTPQKSILKTTQSIQRARKVVLDIGLMINHTKAIKALLKNYPDIAACLPLFHALDIEITLTEHFSQTKSILNHYAQNTTMSPYPPEQIKRALEYFNMVQNDLNHFFDCLETHHTEQEQSAPHRWATPAGCWHNLTIRFCSNDILAAYQLLTSPSIGFSLKEHFSPWIAALGEIDFIVSLAKLYQEFQNSPTPYCFARFSTHEDPMLDVKGLWLPHLLHKIPSTSITNNDLQLGKPYAQTAIISGATEGGKSTFERSLAIATLLAQTIGIVPADSWEATPFHRVLLSFNASDNLGKTVQSTSHAEEKTGTSGFRDEVETIKKIITEQELISTPKKTLVIIDELFQKVQQSGEYFSSNVIEQHFIRDNALTVIVSHREQPKILEQSTGGRCKNYHFVTQQEADRLVNTYKLQPGAVVRNNFQPITKEMLLSNTEDTYNLQLMQQTGILR